MGFSLSAAGSQVVLVALVLGIFSFLGPLVLGWQQGRQRKAEREERRAERIAEKTEREATAKSLVESNAEVARIAREAGSQTLGQLKEIHALVNSNMTEQIQATLDACERELVSLRELAALRLQLGQSPTPASEQTIRFTEALVAELRAQLLDRRAQDTASDDFQ